MTLALGKCKTLLLPDRGTDSYVGCIFLWLETAQVPLPETLQEVASHSSLVEFEVLHIISKCSMYCKRNGINSTVTGPCLLLNWWNVYIEVWIYFFSIFLYSDQGTIDQGQLMRQRSVEITTTVLAVVHCHFSPYTS